MKPMALLLLSLGLFVQGASAAGAGPAATTQASAQPATKPEVRLEVVTEEGEKLIQATVTLGGKPLEDVTVAFSVPRTFGQLGIGQDKTLDDGTAAVPFPAGLPGGARGELRATAAITAPSPYAGVRGQVVLEGAAVVIPEAQTFPRALWAPRAPVLLIVVIFAILAGVCGSYAFVVYQLVRISRER